jgi:hypothetical protein
MAGAPGRKSGGWKRAQKLDETGMSLLLAGTFCPNRGCCAAKALAVPGTHVALSATTLTHRPYDPAATAGPSTNPSSASPACRRSLSFRLSFLSPPLPAPAPAGTPAAPPPAPAVGLPPASLPARRRSCSHAPAAALADGVPGAAAAAAAAAPPPDGPPPDVIIGAADAGSGVAGARRAVTK